MLGYITKALKESSTLTVYVQTNTILYVLTLQQKMLTVCTILVITTTYTGLQIVKTNKNTPLCEILKQSHVQQSH